MNNPSPQFHPYSHSTPQPVTKHNLITTPSQTGRPQEKTVEKGTGVTSLMLLDFLRAFRSPLHRLFDSFLNKRRSSFH